MSDYKNESWRYIDVGLNLRDASDTVDNGQWVQLDNTRSSQEALIQTRIGRGQTLDLGTSDEVHSIKRIGDGTIVTGAGTSLYYNENAFSTSGYSGNPLSLITYKPYLSSNTWMYVGDSNQLRKVKNDGTDYQWGITSPNAAASFQANGNGNLDSTVAGGLVYDWRYTYYSSETGAESNPSDTAPGIALDSQQAKVLVQASGDAQVDTIKIYRRGGTQTSTWTLSVTTSNTTGYVSDNNADSAIALADEIVLTNDVPFTSVDGSGNTIREQALPYVWGPFIGKYLLACGDPYRPGYVYWTNNENPDGASPTNNLQVTSPIEKLLGGVVYNGLPYVFSLSDLYALDYGGANAVPTFASRKTPCGRGVVAPWAMTVGPMIFFVSQDGVYETNGQTPAMSLTEETLRPIFNGISVGPYKPIDFTNSEYIRLTYSKQELDLFYKDTSGKIQHLVYNLLYKRWKRAQDTPKMRVAYGDENQPTQNLYLGGTDGAVYIQSGTTDNGSTISVTAKTGEFDLRAPLTKKEAGNFLLDANPNGNSITVTPYFDNVAGDPEVLTGSSQQKFAINLQDTYFYDIAFLFEWSGSAIIYQANLLWRGDEEEIKHWEFPETSHGIQGWQHVRDAYICLRSNAEVILTQVIDGTEYSYSIPSTAGERRKEYVKLGPYKGKVFQWKLDSDETFRLYGEDCEIRTKPWNTQLGYGNVNPFAQEQGGT